MQTSQEGFGRCVDATLPQQAKASTRRSCTSVCAQLRPSGSFARGPAGFASRRPTAQAGAIPAEGLSDMASKIVVTISASFGSTGDVIGKGVAECLGLPFIDRAIPAEVAHFLAVAVDTSAAGEGFDEAIGPIVAQQAAPAAPRYISKSRFKETREAVLPTSEPPQSEDSYRVQTERAIREMASATGGVVRGRAGAIVLRDWPGALHVRLDGPPDARMRHVSAMSGADEFTVMADLVEFDDAQSAYFHHFYNADPHDIRLYHLIIDTTAIEVEACIQVIVAAARARTK